MMDVTNDEGLMTMCRLSGAEIAQLAQKHLGTGGDGVSALAFGREVAKKSLMQAAALQPVFLAEVEKASISPAYDNGAASALCSYSAVLKKLAQGHVQDEAESAGVSQLCRSSDNSQTGANEARAASCTEPSHLLNAQDDSAAVRRAALEEALGLMPVVAKDHFQRTDLTEEFLNGLAYGAAAYAAEVKRLLGQEGKEGSLAAARLIGANAPDPLPAIQLLRAPIVAAVRSGQLTPEYSNHLQRKLRRVERLTTELTCAVAGFLKSTVEGGTHGEG